ncbi:FadR/GntR family transcriptional regulator [Mahella sp.]|uniref:FadR/GntR family transcriptional regulator n=1 Tax=Mahella sp. TaxID=2798721 RepID=UPI0025BEE5A6|nr:FadR/GntR family transcriptional regulator [Mahella sp.]
MRAIIKRIEEALISKELKPGDPLPSENEMAKTFGVGKTSVREAIKMLEAMNVVEVKHGNGSFIKQKADVDNINSLIFTLLLEQGSNKEIFELREMFEPAYTVMAMKKATPEDIENIRNAINRLENAVNQGTQQADDDLAFHYAILESTHNPFVIRIGSTILQLFKASLGTTMKNMPEIAVRDHVRIFNAFCDKNEEELRQAMNDSFNAWKNSLMKNENITI